MNCLEEILPPSSSSFPLCQLLPKKETGIQNFLTKYPKYDGSNVLIAVLDTGVDPAAPGLQVTTSGKPKIVDIIDCTGAGDVDTSTVKSADEDGIIISLTGRKLKIPSSWTNPTGKFHLGIKDLFDLYPKNLKERIRKERKEKLWDSLHRLAIADTTRQIEAFEKEHGSNLENLEEKWLKEDLNSLNEILKNLDKDYNDCGPILDCVVFNDGKTWNLDIYCRVCIDTTCRGQLAKCKLLSSYREDHEYAQFSVDDLFTYSVNVYRNGNLLEISTTSGSHGTHVASIAAANFPDDPEKNGIAPGAQVLALCIGDNRLGSMETGAALTRAINKCIELNVDIINYSYGEAAHWTDSGRIMKTIDDAVYKYNIIFVSSAGNNGPCLSTLNCPGGTTSACIGVGAYLSPEMMSTIYSLREKLPPVLYPWSARGPTPDGALGVCISGPGGAITSVPNWTLKYSQLQNGTSMSSPNVAGGIACIVSALKAENITFTPFSIRRALENTALRNENHDYFSFGYGLIQVEDCYNYFQKHHRYLDNNVRYKILADNKHRGVYLRELHQLQRPREIIVSVEPAFKENVENIEKVNFEKHFNLVCQCNWLEYPSHFELTNQQRQFNIKIDAKNLEKNVTHYTEILAFDSYHPDAGPLWRFPITVIIPSSVTDTARNCVAVDKIKFKPSVVFRQFVHVPEGSDWAVLKFQSQDCEKFSRFVFHVVQLLPDRSYRSTESYKIVTLSENGETVQSFQVFGGRTMELCIVKWWSSLGEVYAKFDLTFRGITPLSREISMLSSEGVGRLDVCSKLAYEEVNPCVTFRSLCQPLRPVESKISALCQRDLFQDGRQVYQLLLTYNFSMSKACDVTPTFPCLADYLYENEYDSQLWMIFTQNRQFMFAGDAYPCRYAGKLEKGDYVLMYQLRHEDKEMLEKAKDMNAVIQYKLSSPINLECYPSWSAAVSTSGKKFGSVVAPIGATVPIYFTAIPEDKLPKPCGVGWYLTGSLTLTKDELGKRVSQYNFTYVFVDLPKRTKSSTSETSSSDPTKIGKTAKQKFDEAVRDLKIAWINRLDVETAELVFKEISSTYEDHLPTYLAKLKSLVEKGVAKNRDAIVSVADEIIDRIDGNELLQFFGVKADLSEEASWRKKEMEKKRSTLVEALVIKGAAVADYVLSRMIDVPHCFRKGTPIKLPSTPKRAAIDSNGVNDNSTSLTSVRCSSASLAACIATDQRQQSAQTGNGEDNDFQVIDDKMTNLRVAVVGSVADEANAGSVSATVSSSSVTDSDKKFFEEDPTMDERLNVYTRKDADDIFRELLKFVDVNDSKESLLFCIKHAVAHRHYGRALSYVKKITDEKPSKELDTIAAEIFEHIGWIHVATYCRNWILIKYPSSYRSF